MAPRFTRVYATAAHGSSLSGRKATAPRPPPVPRPKATPSAPAPKSTTAFPSRVYTDVVKQAMNNGGKIAHPAFSQRCQELHERLVATFAERKSALVSNDPTAAAKAKKLKAEAGHILRELTRRVEEWNMQLDKDCMDLHFTTPSMAVHMLKTKMEAFFRSHASSTLTVVHVAGKHSANGICVVRAAVLHHLQANKDKYRFVEAYNGCTRVQLI